MGVMIIPFEDRTPAIDESAYVHASARVIGDVEIAAQSSVWFNAVIRADVHHIRIGARTNIQDNTTVHVTGGRWPTLIGDEVTVAHGVIVHGCTIRDRSLIGIGAIILDGCEIGEECLVAAGSLVTPGTKIPGGQLVLGSPAKPVRALRPDELEQLRRSAATYVGLAERYRAQGIR